MNNVNRGTRRDPAENPAEPTEREGTNKHEHEDHGSHFLIDQPPWMWLEPWKSLFEERAAIMQFDGGMSLAQSEAKAAELIREEFKNAVADMEGK